MIPVGNAKHEKSNFLYCRAVFLLFPAGCQLGVNDLHGFFLSAPRMIYVIMMAILSLLVVIFVPEEGRSRGK
jgi:hypothetical protein